MAARRSCPKLPLGIAQLLAKLLVDDRSRTGKTFDKGKALLKGAKFIKTLVVNGKADYPLFDEDCFTFPWKLV